MVLDLLGVHEGGRTDSRTRGSVTGGPDRVDGDDVDLQDDTGDHQTDEHQHAERHHRHARTKALASVHSVRALCGDVGLHQPLGLLGLVDHVGALVDDKGEMAMRGHDSATRRTKDVTLSGCLPRS